MPIVTISIALGAHSAEKQGSHQRTLTLTRRIDPMRRRASAALVNAQHELAFRMRRVRDKSQDPDRDILAVGWREEIWRLRVAV